MRKSVLHIITGLEVGGAETALARLLNYGLAKEYDCHIFSLKGPGPISKLIDDSGATIHYPRGNSSKSQIFLATSLKNCVRHTRPAAIQGWMYHGNLAASLMQIFFCRKSKLLWNIRASLENIESSKWRTKKIIEYSRYLSSKPDVLLYNSFESLRQHGYLGYNNNNSKVIANGFDTKKFAKSKQSRNRVRKELDIPANSLVITHLARMHSSKGQAEFLIAALKCAEIIPDSIFLMAGNGVSQESLKFAHVVPLNKRKQFRIIGGVSDSAAILAATDIFVSSSISEGFPNALGEAMSTSLPCIATNVGDCAHLLGNSGIVVSPRNSQALSDAIINLSNSKSTMEELGKLARKRILDFYPISKTVDSYLQLYDSIINRKLEN